MINGIDLSHWNALPDLAPFGFVFHKCTEGSSYIDSTYATRWPRLRGSRRLRGAYLFGRADSPVTRQLDLFTEHAMIEDGDIVALDWEQSPGWSTQTAASLASIARELMDGLALRYPTNRIIVYCNKTVWTSQVARYRVPILDGLWIASPTATPTMPWTFWQYMDRPIDTDWGNFPDFDALRNWAYRVPATSSVTDQFLLLEE
jgi:GH25 family lysozyme M1 (1,4-beta-N-acetylmuramidase)